jgi:hypothetical protein
MLSVWVTLNVVSIYLCQDVGKTSMTLSNTTRSVDPAPIFVHGDDYGAVLDEAVELEAVPTVLWHHKGSAGDVHGAGSNIKQNLVVGDHVGSGGGVVVLPDGLEMDGPRVVVGEILGHGLTDCIF